jgi:transcription elongation factor Elf1
VTCGKCGERRLVWIPVGKIKQKWTGFCTDCGHRKRVKEGKHSSGTVIHWSIRHQGNGHKIEITCHGCGERRFAQYNVIDKKGWSGLCGECVRQRGPHNKNSHDETLLSRSIIHWGERDLRKPNPRFMVTCGLCGNKRLTTIFRRVDKSWTGYCREHFSNPATAHKVRFRDAKKLIRELLPRIAQAKKLAQSAWRSRSKGWRAEVHDNFPELVPMVIDILLSAKPSECALEQIAHSHFDCSGSTLKRKLREQRAVLINETQGSELTHANATT